MVASGIHVGGDEALQPATVPISGEAVFGQVEDKAALMDVAGLRVLGAPPPEIDVMHHRRAEPDEFVLKKTGEKMKISGRC